MDHIFNKTTWCYQIVAHFTSNLCTKLIILAHELHLWNHCRSIRHPLFFYFFFFFFEILVLKILSGLPVVASRRAVLKRKSKILLVPILPRGANNTEHQNLYFYTCERVRLPRPVCPNNRWLWNIVLQSWSKLCLISYPIFLWLPDLYRKITYVEQSFHFL